MVGRALSPSLSIPAIVRLDTMEQTARTRRVMILVTMVGLVPSPGLCILVHVELATLELTVRTRRVLTLRI